MASKGQLYFIEMLENATTEREIQRAINGLRSLRGANKISFDIDPLDSKEVILQKIKGTYLDNEDNADRLTATTLVAVETDEIRDDGKPKLQIIDEDNLKKGQVVVGSAEANERLLNRFQPPNYQDTIKDIRKKRLARYGKKRQGGTLRYPAELLTEHTDYLQIDIERYEAIGSNYIRDTGGSSNYVIGNAKQNRAGRTPSKKLTKKPLINAGTILLPIPSQLQDTNNVVYGESRLNGIAAAGVSAVETGMVTLGQAIGTGNFDVDFTSMRDQVVDKLKAGLGGDKVTALATASDVITKKLSAEAVNIFGANVTTNQLLARGTGEILNPNMELLFSDVTVRNFRFSFKMTPRNQKEAQQVKLIIRAFKRNMAPQAQAGVLGSGNFFLRSPNVFKIRYRTGNNNHPFLNKFKKCFLTDLQTTYTGEGVYTTYDDGTPVSIQLDLSFKEIQPIYDIDYDEKPGTGAVGY